jgi:hypothetical protein
MVGDRSTPSVPVAAIILTSLSGNLDEGDTV